ncbi:ABC transporter substrate-binding protein [Nocardia bovistercoris]|uniref:ABC transporter substrate-binding protein n=1 Tax=Nocardia bovistercoris TaxID=2785916 RepID=A0A931N084_9NOCA|nr:ABC transporter substrate-binding protein [Nocardia bovistercoris]MBH0776975.1 ABC transporter substrate-binding protein [Nocardia bovistercoris]
MSLLRTVAVAAAVPLLAVPMLLLGGCGRDSGTAGSEEGGAKPNVPAEFGNLGAVCGGGSPKSASARGVTADSVKVGVFSDLGFTKNPEFIRASEIFAAWCNDKGGIAGRKIVVDVHDTKLTEVRQRMRDACRDDFALVGGGAGLDSLGVKDRLSCLLPSFPAQVAQVGSVGADLEVSASPTTLPYHDIYTGYRRWLTSEAYPESKARIGFVSADSPVSKVLGDKGKEGFESQGASIVYDDLYPIAGVSDWTPYAQSIKEKGVRGLIFNGEPRQLVKLEDALTAIGYKPDWIDATNNNYSSTFLSEAGSSLGAQNNVADLGGVAPLEKADSIPAVAQVRALFAAYAPGEDLSFPQLRSISAWLLFAESASKCGDALTARCVYEAALSEKAWTAGGLQAPIDLSDRDGTTVCFNIEQATAAGWKPADFRPDTGPYRCDVEPYRFQRDYGKPLTLGDVGKSMSEVQ